MTSSKDESPGGLAEAGAEKPANAPVRKRLTAAQRRQRILKAARREFSRSGYHGASTAAIASSADCSEPMLYKHFPGKQALFAAVLEDATAALEADLDRMMATPGSPFANWMELLGQWMVSTDFAEQVAIRSLAVTLADDPVIRDALKKSIEAYTSRVRRAVAHTAALDPDAPPIDPEYISWVWFGISMAAAFRWALDGADGFSDMLPHAKRFFTDLYTAPQVADTAG